MGQAATAGVHEWVDNFGEYDFEGVLICKNPLGEWDEGAALRAFQTFQWSDATTQGNDLSFAHLDTGVIVRFDGEALAVECGQGRLGDALTDLFDVLYSLNWRTAELYHPGPTATAHAFLNDIGRAIPARYADFDIYLAKGERAVSEFAEGAALIARGKQLLGGGGAEDESAALFGEMQVLSEWTLRSEAASPVHGGRQVEMASQGGGIRLDEVDENGEDEVLVVHGLMAAPVSVAKAERAGYLDIDDEAPRLYDLPVDGERVDGGDACVDDAPAASFAGVKLESETMDRNPLGQSQSQLQQPALRADLMDEVTSRVVPVGADVGMMPVSQKPVVLVAKSSPMPAKIFFSDSDFGAVDSVDAAVAVGRSAFCFDMPADPMTDGDVLAIADQYGVGSKDVVHLRPGALGESMRWDVLGEVEPAYPFFVEKLVGEMFTGSDDCSLIASIILALKQRNPRVQLRDLLVFANQGQRDMADALKRVSAEAEMLVNRLGTSGGLAQSMSVVVRRMGALALVPAGQAVVDLPAGDEETDHSFTVMDIVQSPVARLFVVHVDQLDGPFVLWVVGLLRFVVANYAVTKRYACVIEDVADVVEVAVESPTQMEAIAAVAGEMSAVLDKLSKLGIKF